MAVKPSKEKPVVDNKRPSGPGRYGNPEAPTTQFGHELKPRFTNPTGKENEA